MARTNPERRWNRLIAGVAAMAAAVLATAGCVTARTEPAGSGPEVLHSTLTRWRTRADMPAAVLGVTHPGGSWSGGDGTVERGGNVQVTTDAPFRIASITKVFVAVVVLQLVEEGTLGLDDPVSSHLAGYTLEPATVRQLLNHTSGIPDYTLADGFNKELLQHRDRRWTTAEVLALVQGKEPQFPPGTGYAYSNTDYILLGEVIHSVTGTSWAHQVRRRILDPLRMRGTYIAGAEPPLEPVVPGYFDADNDGDVENVETGRPWTALETAEGPAGAIVSTVPDLLVFGDALFRGRLLEDSTLWEMVADGPFHPRFSNYGLGVEILRPDYRTTIWGHGGFLPGFKSVLWYVPSRDAVIVVLTNDTRANPTDLAELVMRTLPAQADSP
jgi:D-alanyl-D-alanine carboxypeptidase